MTKEDMCMNCYVKYMVATFVALMITNPAFSDEKPTTGTKPQIKSVNEIFQNKDDKEVLKPADKPPYFPIEEPAEENYGESRFWGEFLNMLFTLGLLVTLLFGASWLMRRLTSSRVKYSNVTSQIKILEQRNLSPKTVLYLVEIGDQHVVIADSQTGIAKILEMKKTDSPESFSSLLDDKKSQS